MAQLTVRNSEGGYQLKLKKSIQKQTKTIQNNQKKQTKKKKKTFDAETGIYMINIPMPWLLMIWLPLAWQDTSSIYIDYVG